MKGPVPLTATAKLAAWPSATVMAAGAARICGGNGCPGAGVTVRRAALEVTLVTRLVTTRS